MSLKRFFCNKLNSVTATTQQYQLSSFLPVPVLPNQSRLALECVHLIPSSYPVLSSVGQKGLGRVGDTVRFALLQGTDPRLSVCSMSCHTGTAVPLHIVFSTTGSMLKCTLATRVYVRVFKYTCAYIEIRTRVRICNDNK